MVERPLLLKPQHELTTRHRVDAAAIGAACFRDAEDYMHIINQKRVCGVISMEKSFGQLIQIASPIPVSLATT